MRLRWFGQSAFSLAGDAGSIVVDPFGEMPDSVRSRRRWDYPAVSGVDADLLLVTHEHFDHNAVEVVGGEPHVIRSTAGTWETPLGEVVGVASEHDEVAGTQRGPNTIFVFTVDGLRFAHFGDFGQPALRPEQRAAIGSVDVLFLPVGDGPTVGGERAAAIVRELRPRLVVAMHYRTDAIDFLDPPDAFLAALAEARIERAEESEADLEPLLGTQDAPTVLLLAPPRAS
jgi:L-ascorbate metabolism protein UlaG (beta-lactamase superfamily)